MLLSGIPLLPLLVLLMLVVLLLLLLLLVLVPLKGMPTHDGSTPVVSIAT